MGFEHGIVSRIREQRTVDLRIGIEGLGKRGGGGGGGGCGRLGELSRVE